MDIGETIYVTTGVEFRKWLARNHSTKKEIWLIQYKKATQKPSIKYIEAVEQAICFGWIDGFEKEHARQLIAQGKMTAAGRAALPEDF